MTVDDDLDPVVLQAAADALAARHGHQHVAAFAEDYREMAAPVVRAVTPLIRQQIRDEIKTAAYKRGYQDRTAERDYDPGSVLDD